MKGPLPRIILMDFYGTVVEDDDVPISKICRRISAVSPLGVSAGEVAYYWIDVFRRLCSESHGATFQTQRELELVSLKHILRHFEANLDAEAMSEALYEYWSHPRIFPESKEVLAQCQIPICVVSNIDNVDLYSALEHNKLRFHWVVTSEDCRSYKPRGEMFEKALSIVGASRDEVLHVGDSFNSDVRGAKRQGIPVLWVNRKNRVVSSADEAPDHESSDLTALLGITGRNNTGDDG